MNKQTSPPKLFLKFFRSFCHRDLLAPIEGDLIELFEERVVEKGLKKAKLMFVRDVLLLFRPSIIKPTEGTLKINHYGMFKNYLKVGFRNILKYKLFSAINIFGMAVAMSVCMFIILLLADQNSYDQFHSKKDQVYRILGFPEKGSNPYATTAFPLASTLKSNYSFIEETVKVSRGVGGDGHYNKKTVELRGYFTDNSFFKVFDYPFTEGNKSSALSEPATIVISKDKAYQLFNTENPIGKIIQFDDRGLSFLDLDEGSDAVEWGSFKIVGVVDLSEIKSHLKFDVLVSSSSLDALTRDKKVYDYQNDWESHYDGYTYALLKNSATQNELNQALSNIADNNYGENSDYKDYDYQSQNLAAITPGPLINNEPSIRIPEFGYYILSGFAFIIMFMACLNYTNLSIARALTRLKEIGIRKVNGASRKALIYQFLTESLVTVSIALILSVGLLYFIKEAFMNLWFNQFLGLDLNSSSLLYLVYTAFALLIGITAGIYPALYLSKRNPISALKSNQAKITGRWGIQNILTVSQFAISLIFIVTSVVIYNQFKHYAEFDYGFETKNIMVVPMQSNDYQLLMTEFESVTGVEKSGACYYLPAMGTTDTRSLKNAQTEKEEYYSYQYMRTDGKFLSVLGLEIIAGKSLSDPTVDPLRHLIINESAVEKLGYKNPNDVIGMTVARKKTEEPFEVIGVVKNFRATALVNGDNIMPLVIQNTPKKLNYISLKISGNNNMQTVADIREKWEKLDGVHEFKYSFLQEDYDSINVGIRDLAKMIGYLSFLAVLIACLGLLGIATYTTERKTKEVGIRKVLGAGEFKIILMLSKKFLILIGIAIFIAAPLSYVLNNLWLETLSNRVELGIGTILFGSGLLLVLGIGTLSSQTYRAARKNPVESLKTE